MKFNEKIFRLITILFLLVFIGGLFFTVRFLQEKIVKASAPSKNVSQFNDLTFDEETYEKIIQKLGTQ